MRPPGSCAFQRLISAGKSTQYLASFAGLIIWVSGLLGRLPSRVGYQPTLAADLTAIEERITATRDGRMVSLPAVYVRADDYAGPAITHAFWYMDSALVLSPDIAAEGLYSNPAEPVL